LFCGCCNAAAAGALDNGDTDEMVNSLLQVYDTEGDTEQEHAEQLVA